MSITETDRRCRADRARQVADLLRRRVLAGSLPGGLLPDESALGLEYDVSRNTVRIALGLLREEGLVERVPGVGTVVAGAKLDHGLDRLAGLAETLAGHGPVVNEVRVSTIVAAPSEVARRLEVPAGADVVYLERRRLVDGQPLSLDLTYLALDVGAPLLGEDLTSNDVFTLLERVSGGPLSRADLVLEAVAADRHSAALLDTPEGAPLLMLERLTHLDDGRPVDLEFIRFRGDRITMRGSLRRTDNQEIR